MFLSGNTVNKNNIPLNNIQSCMKQYNELAVNDSANHSKLCIYLMHPILGLNQYLIIFITCHFKNTIFRLKLNRENVKQNLKCSNKFFEMPTY